MDGRFDAWAQLLSAVVAGLLASAGIWTLTRPFGGVARVLAVARALRRSRGASWAALEPGPVGLRGQVAAIDEVRSAYTERSGVYVSTIVEVFDVTPNMLGHGGQWLCVEQHAEAAPFELTDGETAVLVDPHGAEVLVRPLLEQRVEGGARRRTSEVVVEPGTTLVAVGHLRHEGGFDPSSGYRGTSFRRVLVAGPRGLLLGTPADLARWTLLGLGTALLGVGLLAGVLLLTLCVWLG